MSAADRAKWNAHYADRVGPPGAPSPWLAASARWLPTSGRALDLAGGDGRHALWLAARGLDVTLADISEAALQRARAAAEERGLCLTLTATDFDADPPPPGPWNLIVSCNFLWLPLFDLLPAWLAPGGVLAYSQPTQTNLEKNPSPGPKFLLPAGALPRLVSGLKILDYAEGWFDEGRHEARTIAQRA